MYSSNNPTEAISVRMAPGLKDRITFECDAAGKWNRNKFVNIACTMLLELRQEVRSGSLKIEDLPPSVKRFSYLLI